jgi:hypothetical protein
MGFVVPFTAQPAQVVPVGGILEHDALLEQVLADAVGLGEILRGLGGGALASISAWMVASSSVVPARSKGLRIALQDLPQRAQRLQQPACVPTACG